MSQLLQEKVDLISKAYVTFKDKDLLILDGINGRAFDGFKQTLANRNVFLEDEIPVLFKDLTWFGGGEDGLLITNKHVYYHEWGYKCLKLTDIDEVRIGGWFDENIDFILKHAPTISIWAAKVFNEVHTVIEILSKTDEKDAKERKDTSAPTQVKCLGCRAIVHSNQTFCDYCRSPLS